MIRSDLLMSLLLILLAGLINGSFALPTHYVKRWNFENIWLQYAILAFAIMPTALAWVLIPQLLDIYLSAGAQTLLIMTLGGILFGAGQVAFALAISTIGIGLTYVICLGLAMGLGFLLPLLVQHPEKVPTPFGALVITGTLLALMGLVVSSHAGKRRDQHAHQQRSQQQQKKVPSFLWGLMMAVFAGLTSAGQNFSFAMTANLQEQALARGTGPLGASIVMWPGFLLCTFVPYSLYMVWLHFKNGSWTFYARENTGRYFFFALIMALFWLGSLVLYSQSSLLIGELGPVIGWPLFMVIIILSSTFWSWRQKEWALADTRTLRILRNGLLSLLMSIFFLAASSTLTTAT